MLAEPTGIAGVLISNPKEFERLSKDVTLFSSSSFIT